MNDITRGGQFLVKETKCEDIFTPEDFSEEQIMMRDSVKEFVDKEIWPFKNRFEAKDYAFTEEVMKKAGDMGFLSVAVPEAYGGMGMGFVDTCLVCDYISGATAASETPPSTIPNRSRRSPRRSSRWECSCSAGRIAARCSRRPPTPAACRPLPRPRPAALSRSRCGRRCRASARGARSGHAH